MDILPNLLPHVLFVLSMLVNLSLIIFFIFQKNNKERFNFLILVAAVFFIIFASSGRFSDYFFTPEWTFIFTQMVIMTLLVLTGINLAVSRVTASLLLLIYLVTLTTNHLWAEIIGATVYIINSYWFIRSAINLVFPKKRPELPPLYPQ
jgi:hypothetical protein